MNMQVRLSVFSDNYVDMTLEEFVNHIIKFEDGYFLDYEDLDSMYNEFISCAESYTTSEEFEYLENNPDEIKSILIDARDFINNQNLSDYIKDSAQFMRDAWLEDFIDQSNYPVFGKAKKEGFKEAVKLLYNKYCNESLEESN